MPKGVMGSKALFRDISDISAINTAVVMPKKDKKKVAAVEAVAVTVAEWMGSVWYLDHTERSQVGVEG
ncbi:hypothetical protein BCON_0513g00010 [Botryotinia convoluta]|uniref:Uncharacterized protein n=1 Tax=Botryotinia convoluta TaxID=54673 RepID=A0A4Z1HHG7_9HELO|nr:hypothetical protein BCON_0513g00010 [Botryotinia convoluta]